MGRPKALKPILIGCACLVPVGLLVGLSVNWSHTTFISAMGSSGARGIVNGFGQLYHEENKDYEVNAESGGTATGLENVYKGLCDIGTSTSNPHDFVGEEWSNMKTFTLGWEGVALIYKMPEGLSQEDQDNFDVSITQENINDLLAVFSAYNSPGWSEENQASYYHFLTPESKSYMDSKGLTELCKHSYIVPYVRSGGDRSASASIAFSKCSHFNTSLTPEQENAFLGGQYGNDREYWETDESNAQAWSMFECNDIPCQMVYMTTSFFNESNLNLIKEKGYKIAKYNGKSLLDSDGKIDFNQICAVDGYNWFRPINCSVNVTNEKAVKFLKWIYYSLEKTEYHKTVVKYGIKWLEDEQINSMEINNLTPDEELATRRGDDIYGAEEFPNV